MLDDDDSPEPAIGAGKGHAPARRGDHLRAGNRREHQSGAGKPAVAKRPEAQERAPVDRQLEIARRRAGASGRGRRGIGHQRGGQIPGPQHRARQRGELAPKRGNIIEPLHQPVEIARFLGQP